MTVSKVVVFMANSTCCQIHLLANIIYSDVDRFAFIQCRTEQTAKED